MKIIIGLGNIGKEYEKTRHNAGFQIVDLLRKKMGFDEFKEKSKFDAIMTEGIFGKEKIILVKPTTFMNASGKAARKIVDFYNVELENVFVIFDDLDFQVGEMKIRKKGSGGSHNGMKSILASLGNNEFPRIRIGIESRTDKQKSMFEGKDFVLGRFTESEEKIMKKIRERSCEAIIVGIEKGIDEVMNIYN